MKESMEVFIWGFELRIIIRLGKRFGINKGRSWRKRGKG